MASATTAAQQRLFRSLLLFAALLAACFIVHEKMIVFSQYWKLSAKKQQQATTFVDSTPTMRRRLSDDVDHDMDLEHILRLATRTAEDTFTEEDSPPFRVLFIVTTLSEYDKGTRGTNTEPIG